MTEKKSQTVKIITGIAVAVIVLAAWLYMSKSNEQPQPADMGAVPPAAQEGAPGLPPPPPAPPEAMPDVPPPPPGDDAAVPPAPPAPEADVPPPGMEQPEVPTPPEPVPAAPEAK